MAKLDKKNKRQDEEQVVSNGKGYSNYDMLVSQFLNPDVTYKVSEKAQEIPSLKNNAGVQNSTPVIDFNNGSNGNTNGFQALNTGNASVNKQPQAQVQTQNIVPFQNKTQSVNSDSIASNNQPVVTNTIPTLSNEDMAYRNERKKSYNSRNEGLTEGQKLRVEAEKARVAKEEAKDHVTYKHYSDLEKKYNKQAKKADDEAWTKKVNEEKRDRQIASVAGTEEGDKLIKWLDSNYELTPEEVAEAKAIVDNEEANGKNYNAMDPSEYTQEEYDRQQLIYALKDKVYENMGVSEGVLNAIPGYNMLMRDNDDTSLTSYNNRIANIKKQNPFAYNAGYIGGMLGENFLGSGLLQATKYGQLVENAVSGALGNNVASTIIADSLMDAPVDLATDTLPELVNNIQDGKSAGEVAKDLGKNLAINAAFNVALGGVLPNLKDIKGSVGNYLSNSIGSVKALGNTGSEVAENAISSAGKGLTDSVDDIAKAADDVVKEAIPPRTLSEGLRNNFTNKDIENILDSLEMKYQIENELGISLEGTKAEQRKALKDALTTDVLTKEVSEVVEDVAPTIDDIAPTIDDIAKPVPEVAEGAIPKMDDYFSTADDIPVGAVDDTVTGVIDDVPPEELARRSAILERARSGENVYKARSNSVYGKVMEGYDVPDYISTTGKNGKTYNTSANNAMNTAIKRYGTEADIQKAWEVKDLLNYYGQTGDREALAEAKRIAEEIEEGFIGKTYKYEHVGPRGGVKGGTTSYEYDDYSVMGAVNSIVERIDYMRSKVFGDIPYEKLQKEPSLRKLYDDYRTITNPDVVDDVAIENAWDRLIGNMSQASKDGTFTREETNAILNRITDSYKEAQAIRKGAIPEVAESVARVADDVPAGVADDVAKNTSDEISTLKEEFQPKPEEPTPITTLGDTTSDAVEDVSKLKERGYSESVRKKSDYPKEIKEKFKDNPELYKPLSNKETVEAATAELEKYDDVYKALTRCNELIDAKKPEGLVMGSELSRKLVEAGDIDAADTLIRKMSGALTESGQFSQSAYITLLNNDPQAAYRYVLKELDNINEAGRWKFRFGKKWKDFSLTEDEVKSLTSLKPGDADGIAKALTNIGDRIAKEYPSTWYEKLVEGRHLAMLFNLRTHIKNPGANLLSLPTRAVSDRISALGQNAAHLFNKDVEVTQSLTGTLGTKYRKIAVEAWDKYKDYVLGIGKYEADSATNTKTAEGILNDAIKNRRVFKNAKGEQIKNAIADSKFIEKTDKLLSDMTGGRISESYLKDFLGDKLTGSVLEDLRRFNYFMLGDIEDNPFVRENFVSRLGSYMKAQGIESLDDIPEDAIELAKMETLKATFKDDNALTKTLVNLKRNTGIFGEVALPFPRTPAALAMRSYEYSPAGVISTVTNSLNAKKKAFFAVEDAKKALSAAETTHQARVAQEALKKAEQEANKVVAKTFDDLSKNVTGTALISLGLVLHKKGIITGDYSDDPNIRAMQKEQGFVPYAIHIGNHYYSYDWAQPNSVGLIIGTSIMDAIEKSDEEAANTLERTVNLAKGLRSGMFAAGDAWIDQSPLKSLKTMLGADEYSSDSTSENIYNSFVDSLGSFIPSLSGATARATDPVMRNTTDQTSELNTFINQQKAKIPAFGNDDNWWNTNVSSKSLPASRNMWGEERKRSKTKLGSMFAQYVNPGQYAYEDTTDIDDDILKIYEESNNADGVFPHVASTRAKIKYSDGTVKELNNEEVSAYQQVMGERSFDGDKALIEANGFKDLTVKEKAAALRTMNELTDKMAQRDLFNNKIKDSSDYSTLADMYDREGAEAVAEYIISDGYVTQKKDLIKESGLPYNDDVLQAWDEGDENALNNWTNVQNIVKEYNGADANATSSQYKRYVRDGKAGLLSYFKAQREIADKYNVEKASDKIVDAYMDGDTKPLFDFIKVKDVASKYNLNASEDVIDVYNEYGESGLSKYSDCKKILNNKYGENISKKKYEAYREGGESGLKDYMSNVELADKYGLSYSSESIQDLTDNLGEKGLKAYSACPKNENGTRTNKGMAEHLKSENISDYEKGVIFYSVCTPNKSTQEFFDNQDMVSLWKYYDKKYNK